MIDTFNLEKENIKMKEGIYKYYNSNFNSETKILSENDLTLDQKEELDIDSRIHRTKEFQNFLSEKVEDEYAQNSLLSSIVYTTNGEFMIYYLNVNIAGLCTYLHHDNYLELVSLFIDKDLKNQGIGSTFINLLLDYTAANNLDYMFVVSGDSYDHTFYEHIGFTAISRGYNNIFVKPVSDIYIEMDPFTDFKKESDERNLGNLLWNNWYADIILKDKYIELFNLCKKYDVPTFIPYQSTKNRKLFQQF